MLDVNFMNNLKLWLLQAKYDLSVSLISKENHFLEWAMYQSLQSSEKCLKGLISIVTRDIPKTHKLSFLYKFINKLGIKNIPVDISSMKKLEVYVYVCRYPFIIDSSNVPHNLISLADVNFSILTAEQLLKYSEGYLTGDIDVTNHFVNDDSILRYWDRKEILDILNLIIQNIIENGKYKVLKIILIGDYARDFAQRIDKTIDLLIIVEKDSKNNFGFIELTNFFNNLLINYDVNLDIIAYSKEDYDAFMYIMKDGFLESAIKNGKVLWESNK